jgi:hypothetical protein
MVMADRDQLPPARLVRALTRIRTPFRPSTWLLHLSRSTRWCQPVQARRSSRLENRGP